MNKHISCHIKPILMERQRKSRPYTPPCFIQAVTDPDNHITSASSLRKALGSTLPMAESSKYLVKPGSHTPHPANNHCLSYSCCCLDNLCTWEKSTKSHRWVIAQGGLPACMHRHFSCLSSACRRQYSLMARVMRGVTAGSGPKNWQEL